MDDTPPDWAAPDWSNTGRVHDWKNYITDEVREMWNTFTDAQKQAIARQADKTASSEYWD
jgi:hypothetical protein